MVFFFVILWVAVLLVFAKLSKSHSWIVPIFAIGLGAPRWCQMLWSTSNIGLYLPWAGDAVASALVSRSLWLWLGLLDTIQGVGFGMIFLQTLTRIHVAFTLIAAQVLGSIATIIARACAPNKIGKSIHPPPALRASTNPIPRSWRCLPRFLTRRQPRLKQSLVLGRTHLSTDYLSRIPEVLPQRTT